MQTHAGSKAAIYQQIVATPTPTPGLIATPLGTKPMGRLQRNIKAEDMIQVSHGAGVIYPTCARVHCVQAIVWHCTCGHLLALSGWARLIDTRLVTQTFCGSDSQPDLRRCCTLIHPCRSRKLGTRSCLWRTPPRQCAPPASSARRNSQPFSCTGHQRETSNPSYKVHIMICSSTSICHFGAVLFHNACQ